MNFIEELEWRGMLHDMTPGVNSLLDSKNCVTGYIGFDPTAPSLTIGNYVQLMILNFFQKSGHKPIVLMGGATGRIGDPSGKDKERQLKSYEELDKNLKIQIEQIKKLLVFDAGKENDAIIINNFDFYKNQNILDFLRDVGKTLTVSYMMSKDSVKNRLETGLSFTEFSYQLLQSYDFQCLYNEHNCMIQMGGSDQWGNITGGIEFIRRNLGAKAYAITTPLLTKSDGSKFGKSEDGNIWLSSEYTSPYKFYQFWINSSDQDLPKYFRYFSFKSKSEIQQLESQFADDPNSLKRIFAEELTIRIHGQETYENVKLVSNLLFGRKASREQLLSMNISSLQMVSNEIPSFQIIINPLQDSDIQKLLLEHCNIFNSKSELRRAIQSNALSINKIKISDIQHNIAKEEWIHNKFLMVENGKKNKFLLIKE